MNATTTKGDQDSTMFKLDEHKIPQWLRDEVNEYFTNIPEDYQASVVLDIGANIGAFMQHARKLWPEAVIYCYEPMCSNTCQLRQNVDGLTEIVSAAVREHNGVDMIHVGDLCVTSSFHKGKRQTNYTVPVECIAAKQLPPADVIKIDTEGCEVEIVKNLRLFRCKYLMIEYHSKEDRKEILKFIEPLTFESIYDSYGEDVGVIVFEDQA